MKTLASFGILLCLTGVQSYAKEHFDGKLMDAACYNTNKVNSQESGHKTYKSITKTCVPTASTTDFAVRVDDGTTIKLDPAGNTQASSAIQSGSLKAGKDGEMHVMVSGKLMGEVLQTSAVKPEMNHKRTVASNQ